MSLLVACVSSWGSISTTDIDKCYKSGLFFPQENSFFIHYKNSTALEGTLVCGFSGQLGRHVASREGLHGTVGPEALWP